MPRPIPPQVPRRRLPFSTVGREVGALTRKAFAKFGFADDHVLRRWPEIAGAELAALSAPERLSRPRAGSGQTGATLTVRVAGAAALEVQHMAPEIVARINGFYGRPVVARLKLVQGPLPAPRRRAPADRRREGPAPAPPRLVAAPEEARDPVEDALARLERAIAAQGRASR